MEKGLLEASDNRIPNRSTKFHSWGLHCMISTNYEETCSSGLPPALCDMVGELKLSLELFLGL